jgi:serine/threonine-protein kinase HipA
MAGHTARRTLNAYLDGVPIGTIAQSAQGALSFTYDHDYLKKRDQTPLSLSLPIHAPAHKDKAVRAYLDGLLPDSEGTRQRWGQQYNVTPNNPFALLAHVGRDAAGAVQILPPDVDPSDAAKRTGDIDWLSDESFSRMAHEIAAHGRDWDPGRFGGRWSLAGAQPKIALFRDPASGRWGIPRDSTPTNAIIKPAIEGFAQHHINEALCLRAADFAGLLAARVDLVDVADVQAVISHRYDRREVNGRWFRVHQEDMCQALSVHPALKYQNDGGPGIGQIADLLAGLPITDRTINTERFFKGLAFSVLIGGTDAHAKNYSLILIGSRAQVAPLYDVASAAPYDQHERPHVRDDDRKHQQDARRHEGRLDQGRSTDRCSSGAGRSLGRRAADQSSRSVRTSSWLTSGDRTGRGRTNGRTNRRARQRNLAAQPVARSGLRHSARC